MYSILRPLRRHRRHPNHSDRRTLVDLATINWVRDRALDHAVEKERNLKPLLNLKNLIKSEPSKSLPLSLISTQRDYLSIPTRPIDFIRQYPAVFEEFLPAGISIHPHIKLTPETLALDAEEQLIYQRETNLQESADRLLKLLMLAGLNKIPLNVIDRFKWDMGLPQDYTESLVPNFPDYFQLSCGNDSDASLELVCWGSDLAVSVLEKKAKSTDPGYEKGMPIAFSMQFSRGFEMDKKFKKWVDQWQKILYISPYENALHLSAKSEQGDKWAVSVLHELLSLLYTKKTDRDNILSFGECLGLGSRFKQAFLHHPGIFYVSRKVQTHTIVLRDGYKRDLLMEKHPLMDMRYKYIHLMNTVKEDKKQKVLLGDSAQKKKSNCDSNKEGEERQFNEQKNEEARELHGLSGSEVEDESDSEYDDEEDEDEGQTSSRMIAQGNRGRTRKNQRFEAKKSSKSSVGKGLDGTYLRRTGKTETSEDSGRKVMNGRHNDHRRSLGRSEVSRNREDEDEGQTSSRTIAHGNRGRTRENPRYEARRSSKTSVGEGLDGGYRRRSGKTEPSEYSERKVMNGRHNDRRRSHGRSEVSRNWEDEDEGQTSFHTIARGNRGRIRENPRFEAKRPLKSSFGKGLDGAYQRRTGKTEPSEDSERKVTNGRCNDRRRSLGRSKVPRNRENSNLGTSTSA